MHTSTFDTVIGHELALRLEFGFLIPFAVIDGNQFRGQIGHGEKLLILHVGRQEFDALLCQFNLVLLFINHEIQFRVGFRHFPFVVLEINRLRFQQLLFHPLGAEKFDERLGLGQRAVCTEKCQSTFGQVVFTSALFLQQSLCIREKLLRCFLLNRDELNHFRLELNKFLLIALGRGAADDEWSPGFVNEHGIHLVYNGIVMLALNQLLRTLGHVVAEVVKAEFVVRSIRDVGTVSLAARFAVGLVFVDAVHAQSMEFKQRCHPFGVAAC